MAEICSFYLGSLFLCCFLYIGSGIECFSTFCLPYVFFSVAVTSCTFCCFRVECALKIHGGHCNNVCKYTWYNYSLCTSLLYNICKHLLYKVYYCRIKKTAEQVGVCNDSLLFCYSYCSNSVVELTVLLVLLLLLRLFIVPTLVLWAVGKKKRL